MARYRYPRKSSQKQQMVPRKVNVVQNVLVRMYLLLLLLLLLLLTSKTLSILLVRERVTRVESKAIMNQVSRICREAGIELAAAPATNDILEAAVVFLNGGGSSSSSTGSSGGGGGGGGGHGGGGHGDGNSRKLSL